MHITKLIAVAAVAWGVFASGSALANHGGPPPHGAHSAQLSALVARSGLRNTVWPAPLADLWRSSSVVGAGFPEDLLEVSLVTDTAMLPPDPMFGITYDDETVFVYGGSPFLLSVFTALERGVDLSSTLPELIEQIPINLTIDPYVAKVKTETMEVEILTLPRGHGVNYVGGIIAHENGLIYAVAMSTLFEIDPHTLAIKRRLDLPVPEANGEFAIYNRLTVWPTTGDLILKRADFSERTTDVLVLVETRTRNLRVRALTEVDLGPSRLTVVLGTPSAACATCGVKRGGRARIYLSGRTQTLRFVVTKNGFVLDEQWSETYRACGDGTTPGGGMVYMGDFESVVFENNGTVKLGVTESLQLYAKSTATTSNTLVSDVVSFEAGGVFPILSADPHRTGIIAALDNVNPISTGWQLGQDGSLNFLWEHDNANSAGTAIAVDQGHLYTDDRTTCDDNGENCRLFFVVLDLATGAEVARTEVAGTLPTIGHIFVGKNDVFYIAIEAGKEHGFLTRITAW